MQERDTNEKIESKVKCSICNKFFISKKSESRHRIRVHGHTNDKIESKVKCSICDKFFNSKKSESCHRIRVHGIIKGVSSSKIECKEEGCCHKCGNLQMLRIHLKEIHGLENQDECEEKDFNCNEDFMQWLAEEEQKTNANFVVGATRKQSNYTYTRYDCNRSGVFKSSAVLKKKQLKAQGSLKIGYHCTSRIDVKDFTSRIKVTYYKSHYKHDKELCHVRIPDEDKKAIADKLLQGVSERQIIQDVRSSLDENGLKRKHLIVKKDLQNIKRKFGIKSNNQSVQGNDKESSSSCLVTDKKFEDIIKESKGKITKKCSASFKRHQLSKTSKFTVTKIKDLEWEVISNENTYCIVNQHTCTDKCVIICRECVICFTAYKCSCHDNAIGNNVCEHIHYIVSNQHHIIKQEILLLASEIDDIPSIDDETAKEIKAHIAAIRHLLTIPDSNS